MLYLYIKYPQLSHRTTAIPLLYWWTRHSAIRAVHAAITRFRFEQRITSFAVIKPLTSVCGHCLSFSMPALRASNIRIRYYCFCCRCSHNPYPAIKMKMPIAGNKTASLYNTLNSPVKPTAVSVTGSNGVTQQAAANKAPPMPP